MNNLENDFIEKVKNARSVDDIINIAHENGIEIRREQAQFYFNNMKQGELTDDEISSVSGGGCSSSRSSVSSSKSDLRLGTVVTLKNNGHTFSSSAASTICSNPNCGSNTFYILRKISGTDYYLMECTKCKWTYNALRDNITAI